MIARAALSAFLASLLACQLAASRSQPALAAPPPIVREFRGVWVTPVEDAGMRDWPSTPGLSPDSQRAELRTLLDRAQSIGLNAIVLHVRIAGDAMYPTTYAPWSAYLTGTSGAAPRPSYDPLAYAVAEAHARGLQLHAWFNPFRAVYPGTKGRMAASHVTRAHPSWIRKYGEQTWIDPGIPAARDLVLATIMDVVKRYDIDGVHLDDYFYPYQETHLVTERVRGRRRRVRRVIAFPDDASWKKYGRGKGYDDRASWRRANIDTFVKALYDSVKRVKPAVVVGISPFGIWRSGSPPGITGLDAYSELYADSREWLVNGWVDYLAPQLYWPMDGEQRRFTALDAWWHSQNPKHRYLWPGLYTSRAVDGSPGWDEQEIPAQIESIRAASASAHDAPGHIHFRMAALQARHGLEGSLLATGVYASPALVPAFPWLGATSPAAPKSRRLTKGALDFEFTPADSVPVRWWLVQLRAANGTWASLLRTRADNTLDPSDLPAGFTRPTEIAVTAMSASGVASSPTLIAP
jgi:uncharacterized lipoprotein YddW (UPF0748 family)